MYLLARTFYDPAASAAAALVYMLLPYHLLDLYWRGALPEFAGFALAPLIVYFAYKSGQFGGARNYAGLGLTLGLHILTQLPLSIMLCYTLAFYSLAWAFKKRDLRVVLRISVGMAIALAISAIYWLPAALEMDLVYYNALDIYPYYSSYISPVRTKDEFLLLLQYCFKPNVILLVATGFVIWKTRRAIKAAGSNGQPEPDQKSQERTFQTNLWILMCAGGLFMGTAFSDDISRWLPKLDLTVPAFRWLAVGALFGSLLVAASVQQLREARKIPPALRRWGWAALGAAIGLNLFITASPVVMQSLENSAFDPPGAYVEPTSTPKDATRPKDLPDTPLVVIQPEGGSSDVVRWDSQHRQIRLRLGQPSRVRLKTYNFPGWTAQIDENRVPLGSDGDGIQILDVPAGEHNVDIRFQNTPPRSAGMVATALGLLAALGMAIFPRTALIPKRVASTTPEPLPAPIGEAKGSL
jgi:hypothetical protein